MKVIDLDHLEPLKRRKLTEKEKEFILKAYGYHCAVRHCREKLDLKTAIFHHRKPLNIGGTNELHNYAPICELDHGQLHSILATKSDQDPIVYNLTRLVPRPTCLARRQV